jgi:hypothetical protein
MAETIVIAGAAFVVIVGIALLAVLWRPMHGDDTDRFTNARRITTRWAADAGTDLAHPTPGQPGTVDTSPRLQVAPEPEPAVEPEATGEVFDLRPEARDVSKRRRGPA